MRDQSPAFRRVLACACLLLALGPTSSAQSTAPQAETPIMQELHKAVSLAEHGDKQRAMSIALRLLAQDPKFVPAIKLKAMLQEEAGRAAEAGSTYQEALSLAPNDTDLLLKTGIHKLTAGDSEQAVKLLERCTKISPSDGDAHYYLAQAYHLRGQDSLALTAIQRSLNIEPDNPSVWQKYGELLCATGDCTGGLRWLLKAQKADATLPRIDYDIAVADYKLMDVISAAPYAARAVEAQPIDLVALQLLAAVNVKLAHWSEAKGAYERILALKTNDVEAQLGIGQCELELKSYQTAIDSLESVLRIDPTRVLAHFYLSRAFAAIGRTEDAQHEAALHQLMMEQLTFVRSTETDQRESSIKAQAQQLLAGHREEEALQLYQRHFHGTSATAADSYVFVGKLYLFMGKTEDGLRCLHQALKMQPTVRGAHTDEGILALKLGDLSRAENEFKTELANDPNYQMAIAELGEVRYHQERWAEAAEQLTKSRTMTPELLYMLCDADFRLGKVADANLTAETAAAYSRNSPEVMRGLIELLVRNGQSDLARRLSANQAR